MFQYSHKFKCAQSSAKVCILFVPMAHWLNTLLLLSLRHPALLLQRAIPSS
uniref:Uncharacterized protein n=1 Tax=Arion vulgaris TaxID=1028688 RepID=A0A0B6ZMX3_9EUPU